MTDDMSDVLAYLESAKEQWYIIQYRVSENDSWKDVPTKNLAMFYYTHHSNMMRGFQYRAISVDSKPFFKEVRDEYV